VPRIESNDTFHPITGGQDATATEPTGVSPAMPAPGDATTVEPYRASPFDDRLPYTGLPGSPQPLDPGVRSAGIDNSTVIPGVTPDALFRALKQDPNAFLAAAGVRLIPDGPLKDGPCFLRREGPPPETLPVTLKLDERHHGLLLEHRGGHPLRGFQDLHLEPDGHGGTALRHRATLQTTEGDQARSLTALEQAGQQSFWRQVTDSVANHAKKLPRAGR
jgi:hypothetical protein